MKKTLTLIMMLICAVSLNAQEIPRVYDTLTLEKLTTDAGSVKRTRVLLKI